MSILTRILIFSVAFVFAFPLLIQAQKKSHIVFLISEDIHNYEAHLTIPRFADLLKKKDFEVTVIKGSGESNAFNFSGLEVLDRADLLVIFSRRIALPHEQMDRIKNYLKQGKPLIGIRTANHAFSVNGPIAEGYEAWPEFVPDILGSLNRGYGPTEPGTDVSVVEDNANHPILKGIKPKSWHSVGNVYVVAPLIDRSAIVLLTGKVGNDIQPIAWTRMASNSKVFYTSLGYPSDFDLPQFQKLLINGINWSLEQK